jgi:hypothetical protein
MDIEQRFAHLERSNRHLRIGLVILTIAITFGIVGQVKPGDVIKAKQIQVVNDEGVPWIKLEIDDYGGAVKTYHAARPGIMRGGWKRL